jgi:hypothetical protein
MSGRAANLKGSTSPERGALPDTSSNRTSES